MKSSTIKYLLIILLIVIGFIYVLSPYDILPDFIVGWGWIDDIIFLYALWRIFKYLRQRSTGYQNYYYQSRQSFEQNQGSSEKQTHTQNSPDDPYTILNVPRGASPEEIKKAYREMANKYHPDKVVHLGDEFRELAEKRFKEIEDAYRKLMPKER
jgi:uncharacterized membrane protein YkvA (DUF1232 family)